MGRKRVDKQSNAVKKGPGRKAKKQQAPQLIGKAKPGL